MKNFSRTWFLYQGECICVYLLLFVVDSITAEEEVAVVGEIETWDQMMRSPDHDSTTPDRVIIFRNYDYRFFSFSCSTLPYFYYPWFRLDANPANDTVEIFDIPKDTEIAHLSEMFKTIGVIKKDRRGNELIRIHDSGEKALITFDDPFTAQSAITWFNGKDLHGTPIRVSIYQKPLNRMSDRGRRDDRGGRGDHMFGRGFGGRGGPGGRLVPFVIL